MEHTDSHDGYVLALQFNCEKCERAFNVPVKFIGAQVTCPFCGHKTVAPEGISQAIHNPEIKRLEQLIREITDAWAYREISESRDRK